MLAALAQPLELVDRAASFAIVRARLVALYAAAGDDDASALCAELASSHDGDGGARWSAVALHGSVAASLLATSPLELSRMSAASRHRCTAAAIERARAAGAALFALVRVGATFRIDALSLPT